MKLLKISSVFIILLLLTSATTKTKVKWEKFKSKEGKVSASFPGEFKPSSTTMTSGVTHKFASEQNGNNFLLSYTIHNVEMTNPASLQETSLDAFVKQLGGAIKNKKDWHVSGKKGIYAEIEINTNGTNAKCEYHVLINNNIQYQVIVAASSASYEKSLASKFFKSVKIK